MRSAPHRRPLPAGRPGQSSRAVGPTFEGRSLVFVVIMILGYLAIAARLFMLQVLAGEDYAAQAKRNVREADPHRGVILLRDPKSPDGTFPAAINKTLHTVYADTTKGVDAAVASAALAPLLEADPALLKEKLLAPNDPFVPLKAQASAELVDKIRALGLSGIHFRAETYRYYPERTVSHVVGFLGSDENGDRIGRYGVEGYMEKELSGIERQGDGIDVTLTIDRNIQYVVCEKLKDAVARHGARGGAAVVLDPSTGAVLAMCGAPDFDPNEYAKTEDISVFNNPAIFAPYEPGSVFKPVTMAAAIDAEKIAPNTTYVDEGKVEIGQYTIKNSDGKAHGLQTMTQVLENSLNTGTIFAVRTLGPEAFDRYVHAFGFGAKTGIELDTESAGDISSLDRRGDIWSATGSYGQGLTVTPLQMAQAFAVIANDGVRMRPYVIDSVRHPDGSVVVMAPKEETQVISRRAASLVAGMLVRVVENGHGKKAQVPGYFVAGKTGTAQVARKDGKGYEEHAHIGSFVGFAPVDDPAFVLAIKIDRPTDTEWAEASAAPLFGEIAAFLLNYLQIPPER